MTPIPTPLSKRWREFRIQFVPFLVFIGAVATGVTLWRENLASPVVPGEVESIRSNVLTAQGGLLTELTVERFQLVSAGEPIARVLVTEPELMRASLGVIQADLQLLRARMAGDRQRNELDYEQLRLDWMSQRVALAMARVNLQNAQREFTRAERLHEQNLISEEAFDLARTVRDSLETEVAEKNQLVSEMSKSLELFRPVAPEHTENDPISIALAANEEQLRFSEQLRAPVDGMVSVIYRRPGEKVVAGEPIVTISPLKSDRIVGYIREPILMEPKVGMPVQVRTRGSNRQIGEGTIMRIGSDLEVVSAGLQLRSTNDYPAERGLAFLVDVPPGMAVRPGEIVDLFLKTSTPAESSSRQSRGN
jgi:HlyD family secretion protein